MVDRPAVPSMPVPPAPAVRNTVSGTDPAPMNTRMAVPSASAVSFWDRVGDDIEWTSFGSGLDGCAVRGEGDGRAVRRRADRRPELVDERSQRFVGVGTIGG